METAEVLKRIRRIELRTRRLVTDSFAGSYHAAFKGRGMEFDSVRAYEPGDDVRDIDWNVTARTGEPFVKRYVEERELTVMLVLDVSASVMFGTVSHFKRDLAAELGAVLAISAISNNDKVGLLIFSDQIEVFNPPRKGRNHILRLIRDLLATTPSGKGTDIALGLQTISRSLRQRAIVFLISDFLAPSDDYVRELMLIGRRHDVIAVTLHDKLETIWPTVGLVGLLDAESGLPAWVNADSPRWQRRFNQQVKRFQTMRDDALFKAQVDRIDVPYDGNYVPALTQFFRQRERRSRL